MDWKKYQKNTFRDEPSELTKYVVENLEFKTAIDLGCGSGNDTVYMVKNGKKVLAIDKFLKEPYILHRLTKSQRENVIFDHASLEEVDLPKTDLILSIFALPFCKIDTFSNLWNRIKKSLEPNGIIVANMFGKGNHYKDDEVIKLTKNEVLYYLKDFEILKWEEKEFDRKLDNTHWHFYNFIARKI